MLLKLYSSSLLGPESFEEIKKDMERIIMPNLMHWAAPGFFAYFPASVSYPGMILLFCLNLIL